MLRVAIVDDERIERECFSSYLSRYARERQQPIEYNSYESGAALLFDLEEKHFDIILLDIQMEGINGIDTAMEIRKRDGEVCIVFITNLVQYAIQGYSVQAMDFIPKPLSYGQFAAKMDLYHEKLEQKKPRFLHIKENNILVQIRIDSIRYVEIENRRLVIHTEDGEHVCYGTMNAIEEQLNDKRFFRCHAAFLINLYYVESVRRYSVFVDGTELPISKKMKNDFITALTLRLGENI